MCSLLHISTLSLLLRSWISVYRFFYYYYYSLLFCTDIYVQLDGVGGDIYVSHIGICRPKGKGFWAHTLLWSENGYTLLIFVWNRVCFSRELWECTNVFFKFIVSVPNE